MAEELDGSARNNCIASPRNWDAGEAGILEHYVVLKRVVRIKIENPYSTGLRPMVQN
ncbi:hypothetical protein [Methylobacterium brachiatum]|uniref:hypothetical protein n=1 Tax=Methylobacterium brachiatum TaxID=269660 RepID=UPI0013CEFDD2|nr:hypothetical protein [Methylobacterium brachiatum]